MTQTLTEPAASVRAAALARAAAMRGKPDARRVAPNDGERARLVDSPAQMRAQTIQRDGRDFYELTGYASMVERGYEMWDFFGPYTEKVAAGAFDATLAAKPDVAFLINHTGLTLARTVAGTLDLSADTLGLRSVAYLNPLRDEARNLALAIDDGLVTEMSFAFMIEDAVWSEDFSTFTINRVNLDRGDVSAVNYGANPFTSIAARSAQLVRDAAALPAGARRALAQRLSVVVVDLDDDDECEAPEVLCADCGATNELDAKFCDQCGATLGPPTAMPAAMNSSKPAETRGRKVSLIEALLEI